MDKVLKERIEKKAYSIYEWRQANNVPGIAEEDWLEAQLEIVTDRRINSGCPVCGFTMLARKNDEIICLKTECDFKTLIKRKADEDIPKLNEIKNAWR